jgi:hypothetical protein
MGPRTGLDDVKKRKTLPLPGLEVWPLGFLASSQSLYRLRYVFIEHSDIKIARVIHEYFTLSMPTGKYN